VQQDPLTGRILDGKYILGPRIGQGAIGRVYQAHQVSLDREVAVKVLNPSYTHHPEAIARFRLEARAASRISHPGIVTILDWGKEQGGLLYLVTEYLRGRDLFELAQEQAPFPAVRVARLMQQVALALAHAHALDIVHRDLKPENLRVLDDPLAPPSHRELIKIYDFGAAQVTRGQSRVCTQVGVLVGTPYYMSPEQAASTEAVPQSDLYSCGVIMFLLSAGTLPFVGASPLDVAAMHLNQAPPRPSLYNPEIDPRLEEVILACLAKKPANRPDSAAALAALLEPIATEQPLPPPASAVRQGRERRPGQWAVAGAIAAFSAASGFALAQAARAVDPAVASSCVEPHARATTVETLPPRVTAANLARRADEHRGLAAPGIEAASAPPGVPAPGARSIAARGASSAATFGIEPSGRPAARL
jgi:serine/threonine protein kinase